MQKKTYMYRIDAAGFQRAFTLIIAKMTSKRQRRMLSSSFVRVLQLS